MWKLDLSMQMDTCQHPKLLTKKIPHKNSQRAAKYADMEEHCMHKVDNNTGSFFEAFYKPLLQKIFIHTYAKAKECLNK